MKENENEDESKYEDEDNSESTQFVEVPEPTSYVEFLKNIEENSLLRRHNEDKNSFEIINENISLSSNSAEDTEKLSKNNVFEFNNLIEGKRNFVKSIVENGPRHNIPIPEPYPVMIEISKSPIVMSKSPIEMSKSPIEISKSPMTDEESVAKDDIVDILKEVEQVAISRLDLPFTSFYVADYSNKKIKRSRCGVLEDIQEVLSQESSC